jgi:hypothetical protein
MAGSLILNVEKIRVPGDEGTLQDGWMSMYLNITQIALLYLVFCNKFRGLLILLLLFLY